MPSSRKLLKQHWKMKKPSTSLLASVLGLWSMMYATDREWMLLALVGLVTNDTFLARRDSSAYGIEERPLFLLRNTFLKKALMCPNSCSTLIFPVFVPIVIVSSGGGSSLDCAVGWGFYRNEYCCLLVRVKNLPNEPINLINGVCNWISSETDLKLLIFYKHLIYLIFYLYYIYMCEKRRTIWKLHA